MASDAGADPKRVNIIFAEATGSFVVLLEIARTQALFGKRGIEVRALPTRGAAVPRLSDEAPLGLIGAPAALLQVADGVDLKLIATLSTTNLSGHLVAQPGIKASAELRGKRLGVRVMGAGIWISTMLVLEQLQLDALRDDITMVPVGHPGNLPDPEDGDGVIEDVQNFGAVPYEYRIGKYEVTLEQYAAFLNAVAARGPATSGKPSR